MPRKTQKTPKGHEIPVPTREEFLRDLKKAVEPEEKEDKTSDAADSTEKNR